MMRIDVLTTFPELFADLPGSVLSASIPGRARAAGLVSIHAHNIRDYTTDKHGKTDDRPFGGGPGMVMMCQPVWDAVRAVEAIGGAPGGAGGAAPTRILLTPQGTPLTQDLVRDLAVRPRLLLIAGHYEGIDERVIERLGPVEVSIGDYVLSGGELPAMVLIDAVVRLVPGVLGHEDSAAEDSFSVPPLKDQSGTPLSKRVLGELGLGGLGPEHGPKQLLDCPHYTRPRVWEGMEAPEVLFSGDHRAVARWRLERRLARTRARRPDLLGEAGGGGGQEGAS